MTPLLILPGAIGAVEGMGAATALLAKTRPVSRIDWREDDRLDPLLDRIAVAIGAEPADLLGQSYGGWIAQCFARRHPDKVCRLVLSHSFVLQPGDARYFRLGLRLMRAMPAPLLRGLLSMRVRRVLSPARARKPDTYQRQLAALRAALGSDRLTAILMAQQACMLDSLGPKMAALPSPPGLKMMIIDSDDDPILSASARAALRAEYPGAATHVFPGAGHVSAIVATDQYADVVGRFLDA